MLRATFVHRPHCEVCGSTQTQTLLTRSFADDTIWNFLAHYYEGRIEKDVLADAVYDIVECQVCGFIWQSYILSDDWMGTLYETWIDSQGSLSKKRDTRISSGYTRQAELIGRFFPGRASGDIRVLDFGMGWGYWCMAARKCGYQTLGLDISETRVQFAHEQGIDAVTQLSELKDARFDFINADQVFEHIPEPLETLQSLVQHLNRGGIVRIAVPDGRGIRQELAQPGWQASKNAIHPLEHINCFYHQSLIRLGECAGLSTISQPVLFTLRHGWKSLFKSVAARYYRRFFGTVLYFKYS
jgi:SAM-dependent methyltransferase